MLRCQTAALTRTPSGQTRNSSSHLVSPTCTSCPFQFGSCQVLFKCFSSIPLVTFSDADHNVCRRYIELYIQPRNYTMNTVPLAHEMHGYSYFSNADVIFSSDTLQVSSNQQDRVLSTRCRGIRMGEPLGFTVKVKTGPGCQGRVWISPAIPTGCCCMPDGFGFALVLG